MKKAGKPQGSGEQSEAIEQIATAALIPYARNARTHSEQQVKQIASSIQEFGFCNPVLIDAKNGIIAGHGRVLAAQLLKLETVPCRRLSHLTDAQKRSYVLADNRIALNSGWDTELMESELQALSSEVDLTLLGFDETELLQALGMVESPEGELKELKIQDPPKMTWVLIGIPTVEFGSINETVEQIAKLPAAVVEVTANDG